MSEVALLCKPSFEEQEESWVEQGFCDDTKPRQLPTGICQHPSERLSLRFQRLSFLICSFSVVPPVFKLEVNWAKGNGDAEIMFRLGVIMERCDRAVLETCGLLFF